jgi:hypothetical protein
LNNEIMENINKKIAKEKKIRIKFERKKTKVDEI